MVALQQKDTHVLAKMSTSCLCGGEIGVWPSNREQKDTRY